MNKAGQAGQEAIVGDYTEQVARESSGYTGRHAATICFGGVDYWDQSLLGWREQL